MIEIDGSTLSGSGTLLRYAVALATVMGEPIHMINIRAKRPKPGLRPQHLLAVKACCTFSEGSVEGANLDSQEIIYFPGKNLNGGEFFFDIGTAGSATMLAFALIAPALFGKSAQPIYNYRRLVSGFCSEFFSLAAGLGPTSKANGS